MEQILRELKNYSRWLTLEAALPGMEDALADAKALRSDAVVKVRGLQWELDRLENPGFLQRLKGGIEEQKEQFRREYRAAQAHLHQAREEVTLRETELSQAKAEFESLHGSWENYLREKKACPGLVEGELLLLTGIGAGIAGDCMEALEQARPWMQADVRYTYVREGNRKLEFLQIAEEKALRLREILEQLPEGTVEIPAYLRILTGYITGYTMEFKQLDQVNLAIEQVRSVRNALRAL